jgi:hypothetical protein
MEYTAKAKAADVISQYDAMRKKAIIEANAKGVDLCMTVKSSGYKSEGDPDFVRMLNTIAPAKPENQYVALKRELDENASDTGKALLLSVNALGDPMQVAIARHFYREVVKIGMDVSDAVLSDSQVSFSAYLGERRCDTKFIAETKNQAMKKLVQIKAISPPPPVRTAQAAATQQSGPPPRPTEKAMANTCSGRLCFIAEEQQECPLELVEYRPPSPDGQGGVDGNDTVGPVTANTPTDRQRWVAFAIITIEDDTEFHRNVTKRCATYAETKSLWWDQTSDNNGGCMSIYDDEGAPNGVAVTCHYGTTILPGEDARNQQRTSEIFPRSAELDPATIKTPPPYVPINPDDPYAQENLEDPANPDGCCYQEPYIPEPKRKAALVNFL